MEALLNGTEPPVTTPQSRVEAHLHAMINGDEITDDAKSRIEECLRGMMTDTVPQEKPKSRIEACIHAIITGSNPPEEPKSRSEVYLHAIWDKYHGGSEEPEEPSGIVWSETPEYCIDVESGTIVEGADYVSEPISLEDGYVYEINQPTGETWLKCAVYDSNGTYKYCRMLNEDPNGVLYIDGFNGTNIRLSINPESPDELDLSTVVPVKTDRIWSVVKYKTDSSNGNIYFNGTGDYFTLQKIPVEGGATYKFGTTGTHKYLKWFEYSGQGDYLGYKGGVNEGAKELEETVAKLTTHVILCAYTGETPVDDYVTFIKTADAPQEPDVPEEPIVPTTGLVYELAEPKIFNGASDYIDTGVKLYDEDKDFIIMLEFEEGDNGNLATILHCMYEANPLYGMSMHHVTSEHPTLIIVGDNRHDTVIPDSGVTRAAIVKIGNYYAIKYMHDGLSEPQLLDEFITAYRPINNNLLLGAYQDTSGNKGRFWNGTISKCKVYIGADELPTDEETTSFLMGD